MEERQPELGLVVITDHEGRIQGHADSRMLGETFNLLEGLKEEPTSRPLAPGESMVGDTELVVASAPVHHLNGQVIGMAAVGLRRGYVDEILGAARKQQIFVLSVVLALGVVAALLLMTLLLRPVGVLRRGLERIGRGDLETPVLLRDRTEFGMLADSVNVMASRLKQAQVDLLEKERLAHELDLAREIQASLLPSSKTVTEGFVIEGANEAAFEVGGDYYDIFHLRDGKIGLTVADVAGKGLAGCMVMSMLSALLAAYRDRYESPSQLLTKLDERLGEKLSRGTFITMFYGVLDPKSGRLTYASAGHLPAYVFRKGSRQVKQTCEGGIPLGAIRGGVIASTLRDETIELRPGDMLVQYTDGINEAFEASGQEQFGFKRITEVLSGAAPQGCAAVLSGLREAVQSWRGENERMDDETLLVVSREVCVPVEIPAPAAEENLMDEKADALRWLNEARERGERLGLRADLDQLHLVREWVSARRQFEGFESERVDLLATAVYEACANIAEHGYEQDTSREFELWWIPDGEQPVERRTTSRGRFIILDHGKPFSAENWVATDFEDPKVWRRSRGFGLDIIHRVMSRVVYRPSTPAGNLTLLAFDLSALAVEKKEMPHG
jgi:serine phosphatase RsbU (regulator of sigma subunit)/anti-sigma regulatory factor (Ser/Thr protein kinase)